MSGRSRNSDGNLRSSLVVSGAPVAREVPEYGDAPKPLRLLGEDLVVFRQEDGAVGVIDARCPHRGVSLVTAHNEPCGLRCVYHGWLIGADGSVVEMPAEPHEDVYRKHVRTKSYQTHEQGGLLSICMGEPDTQPPFPRFEWVDLPAENLLVKKVKQRTNFMQAVENTVDASHVAFLHQDGTIEASGDASEETSDATRSVRPTKDRRPRIKVEETDYGLHYAALYMASEVGLTYARVTEFVTPFFGFIPAPSKTGASSYHIWNAAVPIDDENTWIYLVDYSLLDPIPEHTRELIMHHHRTRHRNQCELRAGWSRSRESMGSGTRGNAGGRSCGKSPG